MVRGGRDSRCVRRAAVETEIVRIAVATRRCDATEGEDERWLVR